MIIALSGKKRSGKDTVCKIIQALTSQRDHPFFNEGRDFNKINEYDFDIYSPWKRKMFAGKLKEMICLLLSCTMEQLEDNDFKEKELGEEWWYYNFYDSGNQPYPMMIAYNKDTGSTIVKHSELIKLTPRKLLQLLGTECGRSIHPNIWINSLFSDYIGKRDLEEVKGKEVFRLLPDMYPNWIITDCRFPNEAKAVKDRGGLIIRINRPINHSLIWTKKIDSLHLSDGSNTKCGRPMLGNNYNIVYREIDSDMGFKPRQYCEKCFPKDEHESETALDNYDGFDHILTNDCSMEKLVHRVKSILQTFKIIT